MKEDILKDIPQDDQYRIILLESLLNSHGFKLEKSSNGRLKVAPIPGKEYFNPVTKEKMTEYKSYTLYA